MTELDLYYTYFLSYNLCNNALHTRLDCTDHRTYARTKTPIDEAVVRERFGKPGFEFTLYSLEELSLEQVQKLGSDFDAIPVID